MWKKLIAVFLCMCMLSEACTISVSASNDMEVLSESQISSDSDVQESEWSQASLQDQLYDEQTEIEPEIEGSADAISEDESLTENDVNQPSGDGNSSNDPDGQHEEALVSEGDVANSEKDVYTLSFDANTATNEVVSVPDALTAKSGEYFYIPDESPSLSGYTFYSWNTDKDEKGYYYYPGDAIKANSDITLYAIWFDNSLIIEDYQATDDMDDCCDESDAEYFDEFEDLSPARKQALKQEVNWGNTIIDKRLKLLIDRLDNKYFSYNEFGCTKHNQYINGKWNGNGCTDCTIKRVLQAEWFQNLMGKLNCNNCPNNQSCYAFANFAQWYLFSECQSYDLKTDKSYIHVNYNDFSKYVKRGDRILEYKDGGKHQYVVVEVRKNDIVILHANVDEKSGIRFGTRKYNGRYAELYHAKNYDEYNKPACKHEGTEYYSKGYCSECGTLMPNRNNNPSFRTGYYRKKILANADMFSIPAEVGSHRILTIGTLLPTIEVIGAVENGVGQLWYRVRFENQEGYVQADKFAFVIELPRTVVGGVYMQSASINQGQSCNVLGELRAINCNISKINYCFVDANGATLQNGSVSVNAKTYSIKRSKVDNNLVCNRLSPGSYKVRLVVYNDSGNSYKFESGTFTVNSKSKPITVAQPTISDGAISAYIGGARYRISQNSGGAVLYYSTDNGKNYAQTGASYVDFDVNQTCTVYAYSKIGNVVSGTVSKTIYVNKIPAPSINVDQNADGSLISIGSENGAEIYYRIDNGALTRYYGAFSVTSNCSISSYAQKNGCITSDVATRSVTVSAPEAPRIYLNTKSDIAKEDAVSLYWGKDNKAGSYEVFVYYENELYKTETCTKNQYSFIADKSGKYKIEVKAKNKIGESPVSNYVEATAHEPLTVRFVDHDDTLISEQIVKYGRDAVRPMTPHRRGYTFSGWNGGYTNVIKDETIKAEYDINIYTVKFYDIDGMTLLGTQSITFNEPIDSEPMEQKVNLVNGGRGFAGWNIFYTKEDDSVQDLEHVDSDMKVRASTAWRNQDLPVFIENVDATISYAAVSNVFNGYHVSCKFSTTDVKDIKAKVIVSLLAKTEDGTYKMVTAKADSVHFNADSSYYTWNTDITYDGVNKADRVEVSLMSIEGTDRTGGLIAETKSAAISDSASKFWSEWMTLDELKKAGHSANDANVESKKQYRARTNTKVTVQTNSKTPPQGYTFLSDDSYWTAWSSWSPTAVSGSATREVKTTTERVSSGYNQYRYGKWVSGSNAHFCPNEGKSRYGGSWSLKYTDWSTTRYTADKSANWGYCSNFSHNHVGGRREGNRDYWTHYTINGRSYYWEEAQWIDTSYNRTLYSYRDYIARYTHYKWNEGQWSAWDDEVLADNDLNDRSYEVENRDLYRYVIYDASSLATDTKGVKRTVSGSLNESALANKSANIIVYKSKNTDPTESQLEFVGSTVLGDNGDYSFSFISKEEPTANTEDFIVALAVEGTDNLINVDMIRYDRPKHSVSFEVDGKLIDKQEVADGESAQIPEMPSKEGYVFTGWNRNTTCVENDTIAVARFVPETKCVAFVDYLNQKCTLVRTNYGSNLVIPEEISNLEYEGYVFKGWNLPEGEITEDIIVEANWEAKKFKVNFFNDQDEIIETQEVEAGKSATLPDAFECSDGLKFIAWSNESTWWNVDSDMDVFPILAYTNTITAPSVSVSDAAEKERLVELKAEDGVTIYYTLDGSDPVIPDTDAEGSDPFAGKHLTSSEDSDNATEFWTGTTYKYTEPLDADTSLNIRAIAVSEDGQVSDISELYYEFEDGEDAVSEDDIMEVSRKYVNVPNGTIFNASVSLDDIRNIRSAVFTIALDTEVMTMITTDEAEVGIETGDAIGDNGEFFVDYSDITKGIIKVKWIGKESLDTTGCLFKVKLYSEGGAEDTNYPITLGYIPLLTFNENGEPVSLNDVLSLSIEGSGAEVEEKEDDVPLGITVEDVSEQLYSGSAIQPKPVIRDNKKLLVEGQDYILSYMNNVSVSSSNDDNPPTIVIKGIGNYSDTFTVEFDIIPAYISGIDVECEDYVVTGYNKKVQKVVPVLKYNGTKLKANKDFDVSYRDSFGNEVTPKEAGDYIIVLTGKGNFVGERTVDFKIHAGTNISKAKVDPIAKQEYAGSAIEPDVVVKVGKQILERNKDYTLEYVNNINAGEASVIITGTGNYYGKVTKKFSITGIQMSKALITYDGTYSFTGKNIMPKPVVKIGETVLEEGEDYKLSYSKNRDCGTAKFTVEGIGKYYGKVTKTFKITPVVIDQDRISVVLYDSKGNIMSSDAAFEYVKDGNTPAVDVIDLDTNYVLSKNVDYTISYQNNANVTNSDKKAMVNIKGKNNYKGKLSVAFVIVSKSINNTNIELSDRPYQTKVNAYKSTPVIRDSNNKKLVAGKDYDKNIVYTYKNDTVINGNVTRLAGAPVEKNDILPVGTVVEATITGLGNYANSTATREYRISKCNLSVASVAAKNMTYTGKEITLDPTKDELRVVVKGKKLTYGTDYEIVGYTNNINKGTATVTIRGIGAYGGQKTAEFKIGTRKFLWWIV